MKRMLVLVCLVTGCASASAQPAGNYPSRPIRVIIPNAPGGAIDLLGRMYANWLERRFKVTTIPDNRPGGNTAIGVEATKNAAPDGYTLFVTSNTFASRPLLSRNFHHQWTDLTPVGLVAGSGFFLSTAKSVPARNLAEFIAHAKANPGKLNMGVVGSPVIELADLWTRLGVPLTVIPYKGSAPAVAALASGEIHMFNTDPLATSSMRERITVLAYTDGQRHPVLPEVPTVAESGQPAFAYRFWVGIFGPPKLPGELVARLNAEIHQMVKAPETVERFRSLGYRSYAGSPEAMRADLAKASRDAADIVKRLNLQPTD